RRLGPRSHLVLGGRHPDRDLRRPQPVGQPLAHGALRPGTPSGGVLRLLRLLGKGHRVPRPVGPRGGVAGVRQPARGRRHGGAVPRRGPAAARRGRRARGDRGGAHRPGRGTGGMKRRAFLQSATVAGAVPLLGPRGVNPAVHSPDTSNAMTHRGELDERSLDELQLGKTRGDWTAERLVELYRAQVALRDAPRGGIHAVIEMNPDAEAIARDLDRERRAGFVRGPLHGIPVMLKDNIDTGDRMQTTAGSLALVGAPAPRDAFLVGRLRAAGAVVLGKTNLSEWANFRSSRSSSGWSSRGGQTRNPHVLDRNPCGSSSGSGA